MAQVHSSQHHRQQSSDQLYLLPAQIASIIDFQDDDTHPRRQQNLFAKSSSSSNSGSHQRSNHEQKNSWDDLAYMNYKINFEKEQNEALLDIFALSSTSSKKPFNYSYDNNSNNSTPSFSSFKSFSHRFDSPDSFLKVTPTKQNSLLKKNNAGLTSISSFSSTMWSGADTRNGSDCSSDCEEKGFGSNSMAKLDSPNKTEQTPSRRRIVHLHQAVQELWNRPCDIKLPACRTQQQLYSLWN